jgi:Membrane dipeptidase (Peptidase family M19)
MRCGQASIGAYRRSPVTGAIGFVAPTLQGVTGLLSGHLVIVAVVVAVHFVRVIITRIVIFVVFRLVVVGRLGIRYMTLTHSNTNNWADSSGDVDKARAEHHNGLTPLGKPIVREMNRLGMIVDISHVADKTFWDALEVSKARNMTDQMIVAHGTGLACGRGCAYRPRP